MKVSIDAARLHHAPEVDALKAFDDFIGHPEAWESEQVRNRIQSEWQKDWRLEVGQWVLRAREFGFENWIQNRLTGARKLISREADINDQAHVNLSSELAPAMLAHYLIGTYWKFGTWEPAPTEPNVDIDETLTSPSGSEVLSSEST